jgi:uncharacterized membrane protein YdjX (TVP38/TMEM64 family)
MEIVTVETPAPLALRRWLPLLALGLGVALLWAFGLENYLSFGSLAEHQGQLQEDVASHFALALATYALVYVAVAGTGIPGASGLSLIGGLLFGWLASGTVTIFAATLGATAVFRIVQSSIGAALAQNAGPTAQRIASGFAKDGFNYLLFLRLVPAFPFFVVNVAAGLTRIPALTFVAATFLGIIPGSYAFAYAGQGLASIFDKARADHAACLAANAAAACPYDVSVASLVTPQLLTGLAALGILALLPIAYRTWKK